jgi:hypothetical protein
MCTQRNIKLSTFSTAVPSMWIGVCSFFFLKSSISYFVLLMLRERLFSLHHSARSLTYFLYSVLSLLLIGPTMVVLSANLMIELEAFVAMQS